MRNEISLVCQKSSYIDNWYSIVVADIPDVIWHQKYIPDNEENEAITFLRVHKANRISDADVEGTKEEMLTIAEAIRNKKFVEHRRCAVTFEHDDVYFWSPRNSSVMGEVSYEVALKLAGQIEKL